MTKITEEIKSLFKRVRRLLGEPVRSVELTDDQLCELLQVAIEDYGERVQNEIIDNNWMGFYGKNTSNSTELAHAFMTRSLDLTKEYSFWFSKQVGLQQEGPWELKKDFITIEQGKQVYVIPSGRTVNKVMYVNPPMTDTALFANYMGGGVGFMPGLGQVGAGYGYGAGMGGFYTTQAADVAFMASDLNFKSRLFRGDLVYKITGGPNGTHLLHLLSTPGSKLSFGFAGAGTNNGIGLVGCEVWYTYYDTSASNVDECRKENESVVLSPDQVPLDEMDYAFFNAPTKALIRQLLIAHAAETLGLIRGKFSGNLNIINNSLTMDYNMYLNMAQRERDNAMNELKERLQRMTPYEVMKKQAEMVQSMKEIQKGTPLGMYVM